MPKPQTIQFQMLLGSVALQLFQRQIHDFFHHEFGQQNTGLEEVMLIYIDINMYQYLILKKIVDFRILVTHWEPALW